jgi:mycothiol synthase
MKSSPQPKLPPGFTVRPAVLDDAQAVVELFNHFSKAKLGLAESTVEETEKVWGAPGFDMQQDTRLALTPEGRIVGYTDVWAIDDTPVHPIIWGCVHPDFEGRGLGSYLLAWGERRAQHVLERLPAEARVSMHTFTDQAVTEAKQLLEDHGWKPVRYSFRMRVEMDSPPPEPQWPEGIRLRKYDPERDARAVYEADTEAFRDHFGFVEENPETGFERFQHFLASGEGYDPDLWFIAMDGDEIAGLALCRKWAYDDKESGWVSSLSVRRPWRQRGLGTALLQHSFGAFYQRGKRKVALGVDGKNLTGALGLYERAGMTVYRRWDRYEKELRPGVELSTTQLAKAE